MFNLIEYFSVALVIPSIWLAIVVLTHWFPYTWNMFKRGDKINGEGWLALGINIGFIAFILNTAFWGIHYFSFLMGWTRLIDGTYFLGPTVNVITRNILYLIAAGCHIIGFSKYQKEKNMKPINVFKYAIWLLVISYILLIFIVPVN